MNINISDATLTQINWLVAKKLGLCDMDIQLGPLGTSKRVLVDEFGYCYDMVTGKQWEPTCNPTQAYTIIDQMKIATRCNSKGLWYAISGLSDSASAYWTAELCGTGNTMLIAAMRFYAKSGSNEIVDVPDELC